ncbi:pilin [Candidatus Nanosynbacter sp. TM7-087]|uniref:pilin n=1 Tax=Candidatus Nanosynbacter sp. TM7-087 TaxID=2902631 RepID=UPI001FB760D2|nr:pilin [Candidatus Nanosynbacter sp. TM7-087]MCJ1966687.1 pilin [Candidatus Nanosynbacter sp. TM7-087]
MNKLKLILAGLLVVPTVALAVAPAASAEGNFTLQGGVSSAQGEGVDKVAADPESLVKQFVNIFLFAVGALSVIMLIWGGIRYTTSAGDSNKVTAAKNTVLYAIVGLVVAILAYAIVNMVIGKIASGS